MQPCMHEIVFLCRLLSAHLSKTDELISIFHRRIAPSSCPVATRQQLYKNVRQVSSECFGLSNFVTTFIFLKSHNRIVLSKLHVMTIGSSLIFSLVIFAILAGSIKKIFMIASVWPYISWVLTPFLILNDFMPKSVSTSKKRFRRLRISNSYSVIRSVS